VASVCKTKSVRVSIDERIKVQGIRKKDSPSVRDASDNVDKYMLQTHHVEKDRENRLTSVNVQAKPK
jgi:hypothetical protein